MDLLEQLISHGQNSFSTPDPWKSASSASETQTDQMEFQREKAAPLFLILQFTMKSFSSFRYMDSRGGRGIVQGAWWRMSLGGVSYGVVEFKVDM